MSTMTLAEARNRALSQAMHDDERVLLMGGIAGRPGLSALTVPDDLSERNIDISISELGAVGSALGAAAAGMRSVLTVHQGVFLMQAWPQIVQEASKLPFSSGGSIKLPVVVHMDTGVTGDRDSRMAGAPARFEDAPLFERPWPTRAAQHSMSPEGMLMTIPGIQIVVPTTPGDAAGLLLSAISSDVPTMFIEHHDLLFTSADVPEPFEPVPLGEAALRREGADVSIIAHSIMVPRALRAAEALAEDHAVDAEVLDLRSLAPLDVAAVLTTVRKTRRVVLADQGHRTGGVAAAISSVLAERALDVLDAPIGFVCAPDIPIPFSIALLDEVSPLTEDIVKTAIDTARFNDRAA